jgi:7,8-dihydropterin-6-yl-methyl-4-(beta-D-ribofuranosyl)aminobenzene 5'-phosphate synthase
LVFCLIFLAPCAALARQVKTLKVTVLSTMLADQGLGEWGYSALVEVDGRKFLFDMRCKISCNPNRIPN